MYCCGTLMYFNIDKVYMYACKRIQCSVVNVCSHILVQKLKIGFLENVHLDPI